MHLAATPHRAWRLSLAADARHGAVCYPDDAIWAWDLGGGEPPALALSTRLGLRVRELRLFPRFVQGRWAVSDPQRFYRSPQVDEIQAAYAVVRGAPFPGLDVRAEAWVPDSFRLLGRLHLRNTGLNPRTMRLEWAAVLRLLDNGRTFHPRRREGHLWLEATTQGWALVVGLSTPAAQAVEAPFPALSVTLTLEPGQGETLTWVLARAPQGAEAYQRALKGLGEPWEARVARLRAQQAAQEVHITSGNPTWDAILAQSQRTAWRFCLPASEHLPHPSFVLTRQPEEGFSARGDGSDYPYRWAGQTALDAWWLSQVLLPGGATWVRGWLQNFLAVQDAEGFIDWRPGLGGQRGRYLAQPLLATLAWRLFPYFEADRTWWAEIYPRLLAFYRLWFEPAHDRDQDGFPEWDHPYQSGMENSPIFRRIGAAGYGVGMPWLESPALAAWLYREGQSLMRIAEQVQDETALPWLQARLAALHQEVEAAWDGEAAVYRYRDAQTHLWPAGEVLLAFEREGDYRLERALTPPRRLMVILERAEGGTLPLTLILRGAGPSETLEVVIPARQILWRGEHGVAVTAELFTRLDGVIVQGLPAGVRGQVVSGDYRAEDLSLLMPLWAGIPSPQRAAQMVERALVPRYLRRYGFSLGPRDEEDDHSQTLSPLWNTFLGEGLLHYGYRDLAADLVGRLLEGIAAAWAHSGDFWAAYDAESGHGVGERHAAHGLAPLGLFLRTLGLFAISPHQVILSPDNPFRRPITVQYQGITVQFLQEYALVTFPGHATLKVEGRGPYRVVADRLYHMRRLP
ncbi:MGH1-like glycoside hydrolase domain-containing protein [Thermanaerothrix sp.]|jgi:hypothetical protein|uniref:MGH1-like glycoside hydrolase domain-containing protein n=1 Tax=Thermanaerothrix sp. TaxID=2972675 RepID=UPI002ADD5512|nr:hypothetical protein [Thermanaerothrix sp.]